MKNDSLTGYLCQLKKKKLVKKILNTDTKTKAKHRTNLIKLKIYQTVDIYIVITTKNYLNDCLNNDFTIVVKNLN